MFWFNFWLTIIAVLNLISIISVAVFDIQMKIKKGDVNKISDVLYVANKAGKSLLILEAVGGGLFFGLCFLVAAVMYI